MENMDNQTQSLDLRICETCHFSQVHDLSVIVCFLYRSCWRMVQKQNNKKMTVGKKCFWKSGKLMKLKNAEETIRCEIVSGCCGIYQSGWDWRRKEEMRVMLKSRGNRGKGVEGLIFYGFIWLIGEYVLLIRLYYKVDVKNENVELNCNEKRDFIWS